MIFYGGYSLLLSNIIITLFKIDPKMTLACVITSFEIFSPFSLSKWVKKLTVASLGGINLLKCLPRGLAGCGVL